MASGSQSESRQAHLELVIPASPRTGDVGATRLLRVGASYGFSRFVSLAGHGGIADEMVTDGSIVYDDSGQ